MDKASYQQLEQGLRLYFDLPGSDPGEIPESAFELLQSALRDRLLAMLRDDFSGLVQLLYRVDVDETRLRAEIDGKTEEEAADVMAKAIIARQLEKAESRRRHKSDDPDSPGLTDSSEV